MQLDLLGVLLVQVFKFFDAGFDQTLKLEDETTQTQPLAKDLFQQLGKRWFLRSESIPGTMSVKAVGIDPDNLFLETAPLDSSGVNETLAEEMLPFAFDAAQSTFKNVHTGKTVVTISKPSQPEKELGLRSLWTIPLGGLSGKQRGAMIRLIDTIYSRDCFVLDEDDVVAQPTSRKQMIRLELGLQQRLAVEQRPILSVGTELQVTVGVGTRTELGVLLTLERRLITMNPEQLLDFVAGYADEHGEERTRNTLLFAIAGQIKRAAPKLPWRDARRLARTMSAKMPKVVAS